MNKIKVELTEDQYHYLLEMLVMDIELKQENAGKRNMGLDPSYVAFHKRLQNTLAKAKS